MSKVLIDYQQLVDLLAADGCAPPCMPQEVIPWAIRVIKELKEDKCLNIKEIGELRQKVRELERKNSLLIIDNRELQEVHVNTLSEVERLREKLLICANWFEREFIEWQYAADHCREWASPKDRREEVCGRQIRKTKYKYMQDRVIDDIHKEEDKRVFNDLLATCDNCADGPGRWCTVDQCHDRSHWRSEEDTLDYPAASQDSVE
jgi:hypothetical protein